MVAYTDNAGVVQSRISYDAFGNASFFEEDWTSGSNDDDLTVLFHGHYLDGETELYQMRYRFYSSSLGRWLSRDPIGEQGGLNLYGFAENDPLNKWDPIGQKPRLGYRTTKLKPGKCASALWEIHWSVAGQRAGGEIYQIVQMTGWVENCITKVRKNIVLKPYTEYWLVNAAGKIEVNGKDELVFARVTGKTHVERCTHGEFLLSVTAAFAEGYTRPPNALPGKLPNGQPGGGHPSSGSLDSIPGPSPALPVEVELSNLVKRRFRVTWNCCDGGLHDTVIHEPKKKKK